MSRDDYPPDYTASYDALQAAKRRRSYFGAEERHGGPTLRAFGAALAELRVARALTQVELARRAGMTQAYISYHENGQIDPRLTSIMRLAAALDMTPAALVVATTGTAPEEGPRSE
jgi:DNA-binding XRE family transcriptional regulator